MPTDFDSSTWDKERIQTLVDELEDFEDDNEGFILDSEIGAFIKTTKILHEFIDELEWIKSAIIAEYY